MSLSCECPWDDGDVAAWYWTNTIKDHLPKMPSRKRRVRCCSCQEFINTGELHQEFSRMRRNEEGTIAFRIDGDESPLASWHECETCNDMRLNLEELGYCVGLGDNTQDLVKEYSQMVKSQ